MTANQGIPSGVWTKILFNIVNGSDSAGITHSRVPSGQTGYDTTNNVFVVPLGTDYSNEVYTLTLNVTFDALLTGSVPPPRTQIRIVGTSTPTGAPAVTITQHKMILMSSVPTLTVSANVSISAMLDPNTKPNHRYLFAEVYHDIPIPSGDFRVQADSRVTQFSGICHG
jgi:hypothetical protein